MVGTAPEPFSMYQAGTEPWLLLGEAPGEEEAKAGKPFVGPSGRFIDELLKLVGFSREQFHVLNIFNTRPPNNDLKAWTLTKTELKKAGYSLDSRLPQLNKRYLHPDQEPEVLRLRIELEKLQPRLIIALGGTALWALTGDSRITQHRGSFFQVAGATALATFHPAAVLREWSNRPIVWADLLKCRRWLDGTLPPPIRRRLWINPTEQEIADVYARFARVRDQLLGVDIETRPQAGQITSIAFGTAEECICIPVWNPQTLPGLSNCHASASSEALWWNWIRRFAELPNPKALQNGLYDLQYLLDVMDIRITNVLHDTAILQHSLQPELKKDLGTLGSLHLNEPAWKFMRTGREDEGKADD